MADAHIRPFRTPRGDQRWELRLRVNGRERSRTFDNQAIAERWLTHARAAGPERALAAIDADDDIRTVPSVRDIIEAHIGALSGVTQGTRDGYHREAVRDIYPHLGNLPITTLDSDDVSAWINRLSGLRLSGKTIKNRHALLSAACKRAVPKHIETNPCRGARIPRTLRRPPVFLSTSQVAEMLSVMQGRQSWAHHRDLVIALLSTGMRWGEISALPVRYVTKADGLLLVQVHQAWKDTDTGPMVLGPPKSPRSQRTIPLPLHSPGAAAILRASEGRPPRACVFVGRRGGVLRGGTFHGDIWQPLMTELGWSPRPRIHDLRHTAASMMIADGAQIDAVSRVLGHEKTSTTWDVYGHLVPGARESALAGLGARLSGALGLGAE